MTSLIKKTIILFFITTSIPVYSECEHNVDNIESFYINGMFTTYNTYESNIVAIKNFVENNLLEAGFNSNINGAFNEDENNFIQFLEVARQKWEDDDAEEVIIDFLNSEITYEDFEVSKFLLYEFLEDINLAYETTLNEKDSTRAIEKIESLLNTCSRVIMVTHSQGNFYGNAIINKIYSYYTFPNGYKLFKYPMLGNMQIATPVDIPGASIGTIYPSIIENITNSNDIYMQIVRTIFDSADANYESPDNPSDSSGHSLQSAYLMPSGQANEISKKMKSIAYSLTPYPMQRQWTANSSAMTRFGHSTINNLLDIEFYSGSVYRYSNVPVSILEDLLNASSQGSYFNATIRSNYQTSKLE